MIDRIVYCNGQKNLVLNNIVMCSQKTIVRDFVIAMLIGTLLSCGWFMTCAWLSQLPVISPVSLALALQPWWRHWPVGLMLLFIPEVWAFGFHALCYVFANHT